MPLPCPKSSPVLGTLLELQHNHRLHRHNKSTITHKNTVPADYRLCLFCFFSVGKTTTMSFSKSQLLLLTLAFAWSAFSILFSSLGTEDNADDLQPRSLRILEANRDSSENSTIASPEEANARETTTPSSLIDDVPPDETQKTSLLRAESDPTTTPAAAAVVVEEKKKLSEKPTYNEILDELDVLSGGAEARDHLECPHPLVPFHNIVSKRNTTENEASLLIPKVLHVSMRSRCLPRDLAAYLDRWHAVLPTYSIFFHDDEAVSRLIERDWPEFPNLHEAMKCVLFKGAMKIDVWRVLMLYEYGGVYTDIDNWPTDVFDESTIRSDLSAFFFTDNYNRPSQWFMAAEPRHTIMHLTMGKIILNILNIPNLRRIRTVYTTGPDALKTGYSGFLEKSPNWTDSNVVVTGLFDKKVMKRDTKGFIVSKYGYDKIVAYNATTNITVGERIELESGVFHWQKMQYGTAKNKTLLPRTSCRKYIERLDEGTATAIQL